MKISENLSRLLRLLAHAVLSALFMLVLRSLSYGVTKAVVLAGLGDATMTHQVIEFALEISFLIAVIAYVIAEFEEELKRLTQAVRQIIETLRGKA